MSQKCDEKNPLINSQQNNLNSQSKTKKCKDDQQSSHSCSQAIDGPFIGTYYQAPHWMRYEQLRIGYRINFHSLKLILKSLFLIHNETTNVWTHLIGAIFLISTAFFTSSNAINIFYQSSHSSKQYWQRHPLGSGQSFFQNSIHQCLSEQYLLNNSDNIEHFNMNKLVHELCQKKLNKIQCQIQKFHQKKLRNWLELHFSINFDDFESIKILMEKQIIPNFVHKVQNQISHQSHDFLQHFRSYYDKSIDLNSQSQTVESKLTKKQSQNEETSLAKWPLIMYLISNSICLFCSVSYHLIYPLSQRAHSICVCTDFAGISVLFGGSAIPCIYYGMYCYFEVAQAYLTAIIIASISVFILSFTNKFQNRKSSVFRVTIYAIFAVFMLAPLCHMTINELIFNNYNDPYSTITSLQWYALGMIFYGIGGLFYVSHFPNRLKPGRYDIIGHSHHYWHVLGFLGIFTIYLGCVQNYFTRKDSVCIY